MIGVVTGQKLQLFILILILIMSEHETCPETQTNEFPLKTFPSDTSFRFAQQSRNRRTAFPTEQPLHCPPCEQVDCARPKLQCKGRKTFGICGCCKVCAKVEEERCGGQHNYLGRCDQGLFCEPQKPTMISFERNGIRKLYRVDTGVCKKKIPKVWPNMCKPTCSPDFCNKNPRAICSALENYENFQKCSSLCQHTSCRACKYTLPDDECPSCGGNDFKCIRDFGRCMKKKNCNRKMYPCGNIKIKMTFRGLFKCQVPKCLDVGDNTIM